MDDYVIMQLSHYTLEVYSIKLIVSPTMKLDFIVLAQSATEATNKGVQLCLKYHKNILQHSNETLQDVLQPYTLDMVLRTINMNNLYVTKIDISRPIN